MGPMKQRLDNLATRVRQRVRLMDDRVNALQALAVLDYIVTSGHAPTPSQRSEVHACLAALYRSLDLQDSGPIVSAVDDLAAEILYPRSTQ